MKLFIVVYWDKTKGKRRVEEKIDHVVPIEQNL